MFFISKTVADGIKSLRARDDVSREIETIRSIPGFEIYANAIAEGTTVRKPREHDTKPAKPHHE